MAFRRKTDPTKGLPDGIAPIDFNKNVPSINLLSTNSPIVEWYSNHLGNVDNFLEAVKSGLNWNYVEDAINHKMTMTSGITNTGYVYYTTKKGYSLGANTIPLVANFILQDIVSGNNGGAYSTLQMGLAESFAQEFSWNNAKFAMNPAGAWQTYTIDGAGNQTFTNISAINNGDLCSIIAINSKVFFLVNNVVVATHTLNLPTAAMKCGVGIISLIAPYSVARSVSVDYIDIKPFRQLPATITF